MKNILYTLLLTYSFVSSMNYTPKKHIDPETITIEKKEQDIWALARNGFFPQELVGILRMGGPFSCHIDSFHIYRGICNKDDIRYALFETLIEQCKFQSKITGTLWQKEKNGPTSTIKFLKKIGAKITCPNLYRCDFTYEIPVSKNND